MANTQVESSRRAAASSAPQRNRLLVVLIVAGSLAAWFWFAYLPRRRAMKSLAEQLAQTKAAIEQSIVLVPLRAQTAAKLDHVRRYVKDCRKNLAAASRAASLFGKIASLAKSSGVVITRFDPQAPVTYETIQEIPLDAGFLGSLPQVLDWVARLERLPEPIWVEKLSIKPFGQDGETMEGELTIVTFAESSENSDQVNPTG